MQVQLVSNIDHAIFPSPHTSMYLMHKWWARKPHNVVAEYIKHYSKEGQIVFDPFCGSGVTIAEALRWGRRAVAVDLNPMATFMTRMTVEYVKLEDLQNAFKKIESQVKDKIEKLYRTDCPKCKSSVTVLATIWDRKQDKPKELRLYCPHCDKKYRKPPSKNDFKQYAELEAEDVPYWYPHDKLYYPDGMPFKKKEINETVADLFTKRALIALSIIYNQILKIDVEPHTRDFLKFLFTSRVHIASNLTPVAKPKSPLDRG